MRAFFQKLSARMQIWMQGRYGQDELNRGLLWIALVLVLLGSFFDAALFSTLAMVLLLWSLFRCYSRDISRRSSERAQWLKLVNKIKGFFDLQQRRWRDRKSYKYFRCKSCGAVMRVPRGKGTVRIRCSRCQREINGKT